MKPLKPHTDANAEKRKPAYVVVIFRSLTCLAYIYIALRFFYQFDTTPPSDRARVLKEVVPMLLGVCILWIPIIYINFDWVKVEPFLKHLSPDSIGVVAFFCMIATVGFVLVWAIVSDPKRSGDITKLMAYSLAAGVSAASQHILAKKKKDKGESVEPEMPPSSEQKSSPQASKDKR